MQFFLKTSNGMQTDPDWTVPQSNLGLHYLYMPFWHKLWCTKFQDIYHTSLQKFFVTTAKASKWDTSLQFAICLFVHSSVYPSVCLFILMSRFARTLEFKSVTEHLLHRMFLLAGTATVRHHFMTAAYFSRKYLCHFICQPQQLAPFLINCSHLTWHVLSPFKGKAH